MNSKKCLLIICLLVLSGCTSPVPEEKEGYIGQWRGEQMTLTITAEGMVHYWRARNGRTTTIDAPLQRFIGDDFRVGLGPYHTTFVVTVPPYREDQLWMMVVDGVLLTRPPH